jgi:hypothetical protein
MNHEELIEYTNKFMEKTAHHENFRRGGNLGRIIGGLIIK